MGDKSAQKQRYILEKARQVFMEKGYKLVTMKDIVEACEISRGGLYLYFDGTKQLFEQVLVMETQDADDLFAKSLSEDKKVVVIPTKNIPQGIAAMINFVEGFTPEQNEEAMTEVLSEVKSGQVTYAVRDTVIDGKEIKAGNIMGLSDKTIEVVGTDVVDTTIDLLKKMLDEESELITIYYGEEGTKEDAEKIAKAIEGIDDEMEVEIQYGGQPIYYYFVSVE